jgi:hypothetical protein
LKGTHIRRGIAVGFAGYQAEAKEKTVNLEVAVHRKVK